MGWLDFLTGSKGDQKHIDKLKRKLVDQYRQSEERYEVMDELTALGTPAALEALLERFGMHVSGSATKDEEEKQYCHDQVAKFGQAAIEPLKRYVLTQDAVYFPLKSLRELAGDDEAVNVLAQAISGADPGYHAGLERLRAICENLRDFQHPRVKEALVALLGSRSDEVRFSALHGLVGYPPAEVAEHFAARLLDAAETQRVKSVAWELALEHQLPLAPWAAQLAAVSGPMYRLDADGKVQRA
jgi:hypothetical protein